MQIILEQMRLFAYHGYYEQERVVGNEFEVTVVIDMVDVEARMTDNLSDTLNYQDVYNVVEEEMKCTSYLIEHVANRILERLKAIHPLVKKVQVRLSKMNPPLGGQVRSATLVLEK